MKQAPSSIAIYDLDRTVTFRPTYSHFLIHAASRIAPWRLLLLPLVVFLMAAHVLKLFDRDRLKMLMWAAMLGRVSSARLAPSIVSFTAKTLSRNIRPGARARLESDRQSGALLVLATAAHELYAAPIAAGLGFDAVVATAIERGEDGRLGPALRGRNFYGDSKLEAVRRFLADRQIQRTACDIRFYSDCASDRPIFDWVDSPAAVNPSPRLARLAAQRGWPVLDWGTP